MRRVDFGAALRTRHGRLCVLSSISVALMGSASEPPPPDPLALAWCLERAAVVNPDIDFARASVDLAEARIHPAGALADPRFTYELSNLPIGTWNMHSTPMSGQQLGLRQKLPFPGQLGSQRKAARSAASAAGSSLTDESLRIAAAVEQAWVELGFAQRALDITDQNIDLVRQLAKIAEAKYRVGEGLQQDVIRAQVTLTELLDERLSRTAQIVTAESGLAELLDLPPRTSFPKTDPLLDASPLPDLGALLDQLETTSPGLRAVSEQIVEAEHRKRAARLEGYPDFDLGVGYRIRAQVPGDPVNGEDFLSAGITVRLPVDRKRWRAEVAEAEAEHRRAKAHYRSLRAGLRDVLQSQFAALVRADSEIALLRDGLVPQARQSLDASRSGYEVNKVDFLSLIDSQVSLLDAQLRLERSIADRRAAFAAVEASAGMSLR